MQYFKNITNKKTLLVLLILIIISFICFCFHFIYTNFLTKENLQSNIVADFNSNESDIFKITKITLFSSANATQNQSVSKTTWNLNISQFTDIAIFIDNNSENELTSQNTIQSLYIDNIKYINTPTLGTPILYYKNPNDFGKLSFKEENKIDNTLNYSIAPYNQQLNYEKPEVYDSSFSPTCIGFVNQDIKTDYVVTNTQETLYYDGSLLKRCHVGLTSINCSFSFDIHIINQLGEHFKSTVTIDIPLKDESNNKTIYDGFLKQEITDLENLKFYKYVSSIK